MWSQTIFLCSTMVIGNLAISTSSPQNLHCAPLVVLCPLVVLWLIVLRKSIWGNHSMKLEICSQRVVLRLRHYSAIWFSTINARRLVWIFWFERRRDWGHKQKIVGNCCLASFQIWSHCIRENGGWLLPKPWRNCQSCFRIFEQLKKRDQRTHTQKLSTITITASKKPITITASKKPQMFENRGL